MTDKANLQRAHPCWDHVLDENTNQCPDCGSNRVKVYKTEHYDARTIRRIRLCDNCGMTHERHERVCDTDLQDHVDRMLAVANQ